MTVLIAPSFLGPFLAHNDRISPYLKKSGLAVWYYATLSREEWLKRCGDHNFDFLPPDSLMSDKEFVLALIDKNPYYARNHLQHW